MGSLRNEGNAGVLRTHIAQNDAMVIALEEASYDAQDVVGIRMTGDESVILDVHGSNY